MLPAQRQLLVVRVVDMPFNLRSRPMTTFELINLPAIKRAGCPVEHTVSPAKHILMNTARFKEVWITDVCLPNLYEDCPEVRDDWWGQGIKPKPLHVFLRQFAPCEGIARMTLFPRRRCLVINQGVVGDGINLQKRIYYWRYDFSRRSTFETFAPPKENWRCRIYPGTFRPLLTSAPRLHADFFLHESVWSVHRLRNPESIAKKRIGRFESRYTVCDWDESMEPIPFDIGGTLRFEAIAFDELSGRMLFSRPGQKEIEVIDFSRPPKKGETHHIPSWNDTLRPFRS